MADFCSHCETEYFDIDLVQTALNLEPGRSDNFICEGCNRRCVYKDESGVLYVGFLKGEEIALKAVRIEEM